MLRYKARIENFDLQYDNIKGSTMSIPKIIHYCWFGNNPLPPLAQRCISSWEKYCPEYEIVRWDEEFFDIDSNLFVSQAHKNGKWAFVSDYVRLFALHTQGGIYMDADFELLQPLEELVDEGVAFTGYQEDTTIPAAIMAAPKDNVWIKTLLDYYKDREFILENGELDMKTNSIIITQLSQELFGFKVGDSFIKNADVKLHSSIVFAPFKKTILSSNNEDPLSLFSLDPIKTIGIHYGAGSWYDQTMGRRIKILLKGLLRKVSGEKIYTILKARYVKNSLSKG